MSSRSLVLLRPTLESGIYLLLIIVSAILRFWGLGERPLSPLEADLAYRAWEFYMGRVAEPNLGLQPLLFQTNLLGYFLLGSSDAVVRLVPAAIGTVLVAAAYFLREAVGRVAALLVALFLAFSPISVFFSRYAGGQVVEALGSVLLISGIFGYLRNKTSHSLYLSAAGGALIILSTGFLNPLFGAILLFPLIYSLGNLFRTGGFSEALDYFREAIPSREVMARAGLIFIGMILLLPTGGFLLPQGLQAAVAGLLSIPTPLSAVPSPILVLAYEPLVFLLGILGGLFLILQDPKALFLLIWLAVGLGLGPATSPLSLPLTMLSAMFIAGLWRDLDYVSNQNFGRMFLIAIPILIYLVVQWSGYASSGDPTHLLLMVVALAIISGLAALFGSSRGWGFAFRGGLLAVILLGGALTLHNTFRLAYNDFSLSPEFLLNESTSPDVRNLVESLKNLSRQVTREENALEIASTVPDPALIWYLRDFANLKFVSTLNLDRDWGTIITRQEEGLGKEGYFGERYTLRLRWPWPGLGFRELSSWMLLREVEGLPESSGIIIWRPSSP